MNQKETDGYRKIDLWLKAVDPNTQVTRIENLIGSGVPDMFVQAPGYRGSWIEVKACAGKPIIRNTQNAWIFSHVKAGGRVCVITFDFQLGMVQVFWEIRTSPYNDISVRVTTEPTFTFYLRDKRNGDFQREFFRMVFDHVEYRNEILG
jgi:hypothetical protein